MGFQFRKSKKIGPFRITASGAGISFSAGVPGARVTKRADGRTQTTIGIPGSGLSHVSRKGGARRNSRQDEAVSPPAVVERAPGSNMMWVGEGKDRTAVVSMGAWDGTVVLKGDLIMLAHAGCTGIGRVSARGKDISHIDVVEPTGDTRGRLTVVTYAMARGEVTPELHRQMTMAFDSQKLREARMIADAVATWKQGKKRRK
jgi:hypothetical protein